MSIPCKRSKITPYMVFCNLSDLLICHFSQLENLLPFFYRKKPFHFIVDKYLEREFMMKCHKEGILVYL